MNSESAMEPASTVNIEDPLPFGVGGTLRTPQASDAWTVLLDEAKQRRAQAKGPRVRKMTERKRRRLEVRAARRRNRGVYSGQ